MPHEVIVCNSTELLLQIFVPKYITKWIHNFIHRAVNALNLKFNIIIYKEIQILFSITRLLLFGYSSREWLSGLAHCL